MTVPPETSASLALIELARGGDESAFAMLVGAHRRSLFAFLSSELRDTTAAEDVMQEVLIRVWRGLRRYEHRGRFEGWLFTIAYREVATFRRSSRDGAATRDALASGPSASIATPHEELEAAETSRRLREAIGALSERQRRVFVLRNSTGLTFAEIAELSGEPLNTVLSHMHYAMKKLAAAVMETHDA